MDTQKTKKVAYSKALIALAASLSCLVFYILSCVLSPVSWSPDSSKIALLVTPADEEPEIFAIFTYDIATGERLLLDKVKADGVLSAPSWSPDGKWIAYYKVEPSPPQQPPSTYIDPNTTVSADEPAENAKAAKTPEQTEPNQVSEELFSEENKVLPPFLWDVFKNNWLKENKDQETFNVELVIVKPDGTGRKVLKTMKWADDEDTRAVLVRYSPRWSKDCKHLFYFRLISNELCYIGSLNIETGQMQAYSFGTGFFAVSQDNNWLATLLPFEDDPFLLILSATDGSAQKYFKLDAEMDFENVPLPPLAWSLDLKKVWITTKDKLLSVDTYTGSIRQYTDTAAEEMAFVRFLPSDNKLYYIASYEVPDPNVPEEKIEFVCMNVADGATETLFEIADFTVLCDEGIFHVSPDGKILLLRCLMEDEQGNEKSALIFWDGKTKKVVETDPWLMKLP